MGASIAVFFANMMARLLFSLRTFVANSTCITEAVSNGHCNGNCGAHQNARMVPDL